MNLENITLSEISQTQKNILWSHFYKIAQYSQIHRDRIQNSGYKGLFTQTRDIKKIGNSQS